MMLMIVTGVVVILVCLLWYSHSHKHRKYGHIPGPSKLPLLGNMLQLQQKDAEGSSIPLPCILAELGKQYGGVMWIDMGITNIVALCGYDAIHEALVKKGADFADRPSAYRLTATGEDMGSLGICYTPTWRVLRNIFHQGLKAYGDGTDNLEKVVYESLQDLSDKLSDKAGQPVVVKEIIMKSFADMIFSLLCAHSIDESGFTYESLLDLFKHLNDGLAISTAGILIDKFPLMRYVFRAAFKETLIYGSIRNKLWTKQINIHKTNWDGIEERCLLDVLLKEQTTRAETDSEVQLSDDHVIAALNNMFNAGFMTSSLTLSGVVLLCLHKPELQDKLYEEVCSVVGATGQVTIKHKHQLHYTRALLFEALRYFSVVPLGLFHQTSRDTSVGGYAVDNGTTVAINQWALHHDPDVWSEPWSFTPERFLDSDGSLVAPDHANRQRLLPFGAGERVCVGENFALNRLCLALPTLVQRFILKPENQAEMPSCDPRTFKIEILVEVPDFKAKFVPRT